jgi:hypothetical protein
MPKHPSLFFANQPRQWRGENLVLSIVTEDPNNPTSALAYSTVLNKDPSKTTEDNIKRLERIGQCLHPSFVPPEDKSSKSQHAFANPSLASIEQLEASDKSPLRRFIHCIGTGIRFKQQGDRSEENNLYQKEYNSSFVAADQIRAMKGGGHRDSFLKNSISDKLLASNAKTSVIRFFSQLSLCKSPNYITISTD